MLSDPGVNPTVLQEPGCGPRRAVDLDEEHARAVDEETLAGPAQSGGSHLTQESILPPATGMPSGSPVAAAASAAAHRPALVLWPHQPRQRYARRDLLLPAVDPRVAVHIVERRPVAGAVVIEDVLAGEARDDEGARAVDAPRRRPYLRILVDEPADLGSRRLARQSGAAAGQDVLRAQLGSQSLDLGARPRVDPVEDGRPQRSPAPVGRRGRTGRGRSPRPRGPAGRGPASRGGTRRPRLPTSRARRPARPSRDAASRSGAPAGRRPRPRRPRRRARPWCSRSRRRDRGTGPPSPRHPLSRRQDDSRHTSAKISWDSIPPDMTRALEAVLHEDARRVVGALARAADDGRSPGRAAARRAAPSAGRPGC